MSNTPGGNNLKKFEDWKIMRDHILQMGGAKEIEARHKRDR